MATPRAASRRAPPAPRLSRFLRGAGLALLAIPFVPLPELFGEIPGGSALASPLEWALGLAIFGSGAWLLALGLSGRPIPRLSAGASALRTRAAVCGALGLLGTLMTLVSWIAFRRHPLLVDSVVQLFQAEIFASGSIAAPAPPIESFFLTQHMLVDGAAWYSQYPPGHSALLALGVLIGLPWLVPILVSVGTAFVLYLFVRRIYDAETARLSLGLLVLCPFFWFMGASLMNHVSALFFVAVFLHAFAAWEETQRTPWLVAGAAALGAGYLSRPLECLAIGLPFAVLALARAARAKAWGALALAALAFGLVASLYLLYNHLTTGDAFLPGYIKLWGESHGLGFHETPWGDVHAPATGLRNELVDLSLLNVFLFEWPIPALLPVGLLFAAGWASRAWDRRLLVAFLAVPAIYFFYWHRDAFLGPRFLYSGVVFVIPLTARALIEAVARLRGTSIRLGGLVRPVDGAAVALALLVLCFGYSIFYAVPQRFRIYASGLSSMKVDIVERARAAGLEEGLLFVTESWGSRLLAQTREMGVPASLAEKAYRRTDHCRLDLLLREARRGGWSSQAVTGGVERLMSDRDPIEKVNLAGDPTLRLRPGPLADSCAEEILYDRQGFSVFTPHLPANRPTLDGAFVVARDLRDRNRELRELYPGKPAYLYRNGRFTPLE